MIALLFLCFAVYCAYELEERTSSNSFRAECRAEQEKLLEFKRSLMLRHKGE